MAKLNVTRIAVAAGVGVVDELLERNDVKNGRTGAFKTWSDYGRIVMPVAGAALQMFMPKYAGIGETVLIASTSLLVKSIAKAAMPATTAYSPRSVSAPRAVARGPYSTLGHQEEFQTTRIL